MTAQIGDAEDSSAFARVVSVRFVIAAAFVSQLLLCCALWNGTAHTYPVIPLLPGLPVMPFEVGRALFCLMLVLLILTAVSKRSRRYIAVFLAIAVFYGLFDCLHWQPWFYQYSLMLFAFLWYGERDESVDELLNTNRLIVASTYFWSGLQKLNASFITSTFPWMFKPLIGEVPADVCSVCAVGSALLEFAIGIGLLFGRTRTAALVACLGMHIVILWCLGPLLHWNSVVWPWNLSMPAFALLLFKGSNVKPLAIIKPKGLGAHTLVLVFCGLMPGLNFLNLWDCNFSDCLYSGNQATATIQFSRDVRNTLPAVVALHCSGSANDKYALDLMQWSMAELNVQPYPQIRVFRQVGREFAKMYGTDADPKLVIKPRSWLTADPPTIQIPCSKL